MDVLPLSAHFFIFYYGVLAVLTPPVALAAYAAAGIAGSDMTKTGWTAVKLALAGFIIPYVAVFSPAILMQGEVLEILQVTATSVVGICALAVAFQGYPIENKPLRGVLMASSLLLLDPGGWTDLIGIGLVGAVFLSTWLASRRSEKG